MPNVIVNSCYIKSSQHFINYLEYAGEKLEAQTLVLNDGTHIELDPDELVDISETPDFRYIQLELKDGTIRRLGTEKYQAYVNERTEGVTINDAAADENFSIEDKGYLERSPEKYIDYIAFRPSVERNPNESHGLFGINGAVDIEAAKASVLENENSIKWSHIISLTREGAEETGFDNRQAWENLIRAKAYDIGKLYNIPPEHLEIMAAYHDKAHHPHCHLFFYSNANTTKEGCAGFGEGDLTKASEKLRSMMNNEIFKDQTSYLKEEKTRFREEMKAALRTYVHDIGQNGYAADKDIVDSFLDLAESLSDYSGKANYKFLSLEQKQKVNDFLRTAVSSDGNLSEIYAKVIENQRSFIKMYNDDSEKINARLEDFQNHFFEPTDKNDMRQLHNIIIKQVMLFNNGVAPVNQKDSAEDVVRKEKTSFQEVKEDLTFTQLLPDSPEKEDMLNSILEAFENKANEGNSMAAYELGRHYKLGTFGEKNTELSQQYFGKALSGFIDELNSDRWLENMKALANFRVDHADLPQEEFEKGIYKFIKNKEQIEWKDNYLNYKVGRMLIDGVGTEKNVLEGISYLEQSTLPLAHYTLGNLYYNGADDLEPDMQKAYDHFTSAGFPEEGNSVPFAVYNMAEMLEQELVADDRLSADYLYRKALSDFIDADNENPNDFIEYKVASMYLEGKGCEIDEGAAEEYLIKSAEAGNRQAPIRLANLYIDLDLPDEGIRVLQIASSNNNSSASYLLGKIYLEGEIISRDVDKAIEYITKAANQKNSFAAYKLGNLYSQGELVKPDKAIASGWYAKAYSGFIRMTENDIKNNADPNDTVLYYLGNMNYHGIGTNQDIAKAIEYLTLSADRENGAAQFRLGSIYLEEKDFQDFDKAIEYLTKAADQENPFAAYKLGNLYSQEEEYFAGADEATADEWYSRAYKGFSEMIENDIKSNADPNDTVLHYLGNMNYQGLGTDQDIAKAIEYLTSSADLENGAAQFRLGSIYLEEKDFRDLDKAILFLTKAADQENPFAAYKLGNLYSQDEKDFPGADKATADEWCSRAYKGFSEMIENDIKSNADPNDTVLYYLGNMNYQGIGTEQDIAKAIECLTLSADRENGAAQFRLGSIYLEEKDFQDFDKAIEYLTKAADQENPFAAYKLGQVYSEGRFFWPQEFFPNKTIADKWYAQAYEGFVKMIQSEAEPNTAVLYNLGNMTLNGLGTRQNIYSAIDYFAKAAYLGNEFAQYRLGKIYLEGEFVLTDMTKALYYFNAAADQNNQFAQYELGKIYYYGADGIPKDVDKAIYYFKKSAAQGNVYAQRKLQYIADEPRRKAAYATSLLLSRIAYVMSQMAMQNAYNNEQNREEEEKERNEQPRFTSKNHQHSRSHLTTRTPIQF